MIQEEVIDAYLFGDFKVEFLSLIPKLLKLIGHYLLNGEDLNTKVLKNGGSGKLLKDLICYQMKFFGERKKPFQTE
jgi:hypothetical protein